MEKLNFTQYQYRMILDNLQFDYKKQEKTIFEMLCNGHRIKKIAKEINVSQRTVSYRKRDLLKKINFYLKEKELLKETYCVYMHKFPNGKVYIGMTTNIKQRWQNGLGYPYPVMTGGFGGNGGFGFGGDGALWLIVLLALIWGNNGNNGFGGFGGNSFDNGYAWLSNGQKEIMQNTNNGFDTLHLSNQLDTVNSGIYSLSNQLCNCCADMQQTVSNGFFNAEIADSNRQMANMNQLFGISTQLCNASADNRLGIQDLKATVISENCSDREVLREIGQSILVNQTANTQKIIDEIFRDRLDEKDDKIADLNRQLQTADLRASQIAQTQAITSNIYNELKNCPIGTVPVYGNQAIFSCPGNNGCGCGFNTTSQFI